MTNGQMLFYSGVALMAVTVLLAVYFWVKRPKYEPTSTIYEEAEEHGTQRLRSGYPTVRLTRLWEGRTRKKDVPVDKVKAPAETPPPQEQQTVPLQTQPLQQRETEPLTMANETEVLEEPIKEKETEPLAVPLQGTISLAQSDDTIPLAETPGREMKRTEVLREDGENQDV